MLNKDYSDMLSLFTEKKVDYILVGAYALAAHGYVRATMDIDLWVKPERQNAERVYEALEQFGAPLEKVSTEDFVKEDVVFQIGVEPRRIDILTSLSGLNYDEAVKNSVIKEMEGKKIKILSIKDQIQNKKSTGRVKDLADAEELEKLL